MQPAFQSSVTGLSTSVASGKATSQCSAAMKQMRSINAMKSMPRATMNARMLTTAPASSFTPAAKVGFFQAAPQATASNTALSMLLGGSNSKTHGPGKVSIGQFGSKKSLLTVPTPQNSLLRDLAKRDATSMMAKGPWDEETAKALEAASKQSRIKHLEEQAMNAIEQAVASGAQVVFPNALIAGDVVLTHLISRLGLFEKIPVLFVNTLHLFDETLDFIDEIEKHYGFKGHVSMAEGITGDRYEAKK